MESFNILASVMSIVFHDDSRTSILLVSHEFLRLYHTSRIYSTDAGKLGKKVDSFLNKSTSTEVSIYFLID